MKEKLLFFRKGKSYYYIFDNQQYLCNSQNIRNLKEKLILPSKIVFKGLSRAQVGRVIGSLLDNSTDFVFSKVNKDSDNILKLEVIIYQVSKINELNNQLNQQDNINKILILRKKKK